MPKKWTEERRKEVLDLYTTGLAAYKVARVLHASPNDVILAARAAGVERPDNRAPKRPWTREREERLIRMYKEGMSGSEIARKTGECRGSVEEVVRNAGLTRPTGWWMCGPRNHAWNGGRTIDKSGYILVRVPDHPQANHSGYVREHRVAMEKKIGRCLLPAEVVHHIDGNRANNHPDNLQLHRCNSDHLREELKGRCPNWTPDGKRRILEGVARMSANAKKRRDAEAARQQSSTRTE
jgi:hypothetical protein